MKLKYIILSIVSILLISGCNVDNIEKEKNTDKDPIEVPKDDKPSPSVQFFNGSKVYNMDYICKLNGNIVENNNTGESGDIFCEIGNELTLKLGDITLPKFTISESNRLMSFSKLISDKVKSEELARFILSLDNDNDINNGIHLDNNIMKYIIKNIDVTSSNMINEIEMMLGNRINIIDVKSSMEKINKYLNDNKLIPNGEPKQYFLNEDKNITTILKGTSSKDGENQYFEIMKNPNNGNIVGFDSNGTFTYVPNINYNGDDYFTFKVIDSNGESIETYVNFTIKDVNDLPNLLIKHNVKTNGLEDTVYNGVINVSDIDGHIVGIDVVDRRNGSVTISNNGHYSFSPNVNYNGTDGYFSFKVKDNSGGETFGSMRIEFKNQYDQFEIVYDEYISSQNFYLYTVSMADLESNEFVLNIIKSEDIDSTLTSTITKEYSLANSFVGEIVKTNYKDYIIKNLNGEQSALYEIILNDGTTEKKLKINLVK